MRDHGYKELTPCQALFEGVAFTSHLSNMPMSWSHHHHFAVTDEETMVQKAYSPFPRPTNHLLVERGQRLKQSGVETLSCVTSHQTMLSVHTARSQA